MSIGKIITLISYRGGTGRTMAVANLAWMLASTGKRVLAIDWNLRAPRLAEFFYPFYPANVDLRKEAGIIDILWEYILEVYRPQSKIDETIDLISCIGKKIHKLNWEFSNAGSVDILNSGYFDTYRMRTELFPYEDFFSHLKGGIFIEDLRNFLISNYDYVLIDGPLILEDTGSICSIQLADYIGICFSPFGNEADASAEAIKRIQKTADNLSYNRFKQTIAPIIMRTERAESKLHNQLREQVKKSFSSLTTSSSQIELDLEVPQIAYYVYKQTLTYFSENSHSTSLNKAYEYILKRITSDSEFTSNWPTQEEADIVMEQYAKPCPPLLNWWNSNYNNTANLRPAEVKKHHFFISYKRNDFIRIKHVIGQMQAMGFDIWWDEGIHGGMVWRDILRTKIETSCAVILFITKNSVDSIYMKEEIDIAKKSGKPILPFVVDPVEPESEYQELLTNVQYINCPGTVPERQLEITLRKLCMGYKQFQ